MASLRNRLLLWLLTALGVTATLAGVAVYLASQEEVDELFDYQLEQIAVYLAHQEQVPRLAPEHANGEGLSNEDDLVVQVWSHAGELLYASPASMRLPAVPETGFATMHWLGEEWRSFTTRDHGHIVTVAQPIHERQEINETVALTTALPAFVLLPVMGLLIWLAVGRVLRPLDDVADAVSRRTAVALQPVPVDGLPREIRPLVRALNDLLGRLEQALAAQRRFIADAAHELRTPLTALQVQAQLLQRTQEPAEQRDQAERLQAGLKRATHLVHQLLTLARVEPEAAQQAFTPVALTPLAREVVAERSDLAAERGVDLGFGRNDEDVVVPGDPEGLRVLLGNLVDNAVRYTPAGGRVDVSVFRNDREAVLEVLDTGPGIPPEERARVFDRFYRRAGSHTEGSGLGLSIVQGIADRHGARVRLEEGPEGRGLRAVVALPVEAEPAGTP